MKQRVISFLLIICLVFGGVEPLTLSAASIHENEDDKIQEENNTDGQKNEQENIKETITKGDNKNNTYLRDEIQTLDKIYNGTCGTNVSWNFDDLTGTLTISGNGDMTEYTDTLDIPWKDYREYITNVVIMPGVTSIGNFSFWHCKKLIKVSMPDTMIKIGMEAFGYCTKLADIYIPYSVNSIAVPAFSNCISLTNINVDPENKVYCSKDGILYDKERVSLICYPSGKSASTYTISKDITSIATGAFTDCPYLMAIDVVPENKVFISENGILYNASKSMLMRYPVGKSADIFEIPAAVKNKNFSQ